MAHNKNFHNEPFDEGTLCKLDLYKLYLRTWIPTFLNSPWVDSIQIFDFFAGPGSDGFGNDGSPLLAAEELRAAIVKHCETKSLDKTITLYLNELDSEKFQMLQSVAANIEKQIPNIKVITTNSDFASLFPQYLASMRASRTANFIFIDQYGLKEVSEETFKSLVCLQKTDFMFYLAASTANRFKYIESVVKCIPPLSQEEKDKMNGNNALQILSRAYENYWLPEHMRTSYFLGDFSIKKGANVYGLIFGSHHPAGIEKFLRAAWKLGGFANFDIDKDGFRPGEDSLFEEFKIPTRIQEFQRELEEFLRTKPLKTNKWLYGVGLKNGMLPQFVRPVTDKLYKEGFIKNKLLISYDAWKRKPSEEIKYAEEGETP